MGVSTYDKITVIKCSYSTLYATLRLSSQRKVTIREVTYLTEASIKNLSLLPPMTPLTILYVTIDNHHQHDETSSSQLFSLLTDVLTDHHKTNLLLQFEEEPIAV